MVLENSKVKGQFSFWKHEAFTGIGILESHGVVENGDSLHLQAIHCGLTGFWVGASQRDEFMG